MSNPNHLLHLNFCHYSAVHDCLPLELPEDVSGVRAHKPVEKVLRAYCRGAGLEVENEVESLELARCFCHSNTARTPTPLDRNETVENSNLRDGDYVFVRRIQEQDRGE